MGRFNVVIEENLKTEVTLIPKQWTTGKIVRARAIAGIGNKNDENQPWVIMTLSVEITESEVCQIVNEDKVVLDFSPYIKLNEKGQAESNNSNVDFSKALAVCGLNLSDPDTKEVLVEAVKEAKTDTEELQFYYKKLGELCISPQKIAVYIDQRKSSRNSAIMENVISSIAVLPED